MRTIDMATFLTLTRTRHFGRTAAEMNATQPAISARLARLESELGCRLIQRGDGDFRLTAEGMRVLAAFQQVEECLDAMQSDLHAGDAALPANIRIGAIDSVASTWMPHLIETLRDLEPRLRVELTVEGTKGLVEGMGKGMFDLIFCLDPAIGEHRRSFVICVWQMIWAASPRLVDRARTYSVDELARMPIVTFPKDTPPYRQIAPYFQDESVLASKMTSSNSLFAIVNLVIDGFGVAALPTVTIERELATGLLCPITVRKWFPPMPIIATYQASTHQKVVQRVTEQARASARLYCERAQSGTAWTI